MTLNPSVLVLHTCAPHGLFGAIYIKAILPAYVVNCGMMDGMVTLGNGNDCFQGGHWIQPDIYARNGNGLITQGPADKRRHSATPTMSCKPTSVLTKFTAVWTTTAPLTGQTTTPPVETAEKTDSCYDLRMAMTA